MALKCFYIAQYISVVSMVFSIIPIYLRYNPYIYIYVYTHTNAYTLSLCSSCSLGFKVLGGGSRGGAEGMAGSLQALVGRKRKYSAALGYATFLNHSLQAILHPRP